MKKQIMINQETILETKIIKGTEKIETISPETIEVPNYDY